MAGGGRGDGCVVTVGSLAGATHETAGGTAHETTGATARGTAHGVGVLVAPRTVITCAHVVNAALGRPPDAAEPPGVPLEVSWPRLPGDVAGTARVTGWRPLETGDLAVLALDADAPAGATPARLAAGVPGRGTPLEVFGYPAGRPLGQFASVRMGGVVGGGLFQLNSRDAGTPDVRAGYSGSPVIDEAAGVVLGVVAQAPATGLDSLAIPAATVLELWQPPAPPAPEPGGSVAVLHLPGLWTDSRPEPDLTGVVPDGARPDLVIVTGDLASTGMPGELDAAFGYLGRLADRWDLPRHRIAVVPGPGDVNRKACAAYFLDAESDGREPSPPYWPKWRHFAAAFERFYGETGPAFTPDRPWTLFEMPDIGTAVIGLNSTMADSHLGSPPDGEIGDRQWEWYSQVAPQQFAANAFVVVAANRPGSLRHRVFPAHALVLDGADASPHLLASPRVAPVPDPAVTRHAYRDALLDDVAEITRLLHPGAELTKNPAPAAGEAYLLATVRDPLGPVDRWPVGVVPGPVDAATLRRFADVVDAPLRSADPQLRSHLVYAGPPPADDVRAAATARGVALHSLAEYRGVIDLERVRTRQAQLLASDDRYPEELFVPQRFRQEHPVRERGPDGRPAVEDDALGRIVGWLGEDGARFVTVLGDFGRGKTFLLRQLVRHLPRHVGGLEPVLVELRTLEKGPDLFDVVGQHLRRLDVGNVTDAKVRHLVTRGRVALLLDGFDELVQKVTYPTAAAYLTTLLDAATGDAKIVLTSRTQHFSDDGQVRKALLTTTTGRDATRIVAIEDFSEDQIRAFLVRHYAGDTARAERRHRRLADIHDLLGLSRNARMLGFIADLPDARLAEAAGASDRAGAAGLYREIVDHWLDGEVKRQTFRFGPRALPEEPRLAACRALALNLWTTARTGSGTVSAAELDRVAGTLADLQRLGFSDAEAGHTIGSGSLLTRSGDGFGFVHRSVMEWLVADTAAAELAAGRQPKALAAREMSDLMTDFFCDLAGPAALDWALATSVSNSADPRGADRNNAVRVLARLNRREPPPVTGSPPGARSARLVLGGQDLRDQDITALARDGGLRGADLRGTDWRGLVVSDIDLTGADLGEANLRDVALIGVRLTGASLRGADLSRTRLVDVDLTDADLTGARTRRTAVLGGTGADRQPVPLTRVPGDPTPAMLAVADAVSRATALPSLGLVALARGPHVELFDVASRAPVRVLARHDGSVRALMTFIAADGGVRLAAGGNDTSVVVWELGSGEPVSTTVSLHRFPVLALAALRVAGRSLLASADRGGIIRVWDPATREPVRRPFEAPGGAVHALATVPTGGPDTLLASGGADGAIRLWDAGAGALLQTWTPPEPVPITALAAVRLGGTTIIASLDTRNRLRLFDDLATGSGHHVTSGHTAEILDLAVVTGPAGDVTFATADASGEIQLTLPDGKLLARTTLVGLRLTWCTAVPDAEDGAILLAGDASGDVISLRHNGGGVLETDRHTWRRPPAVQVTTLADGLATGDDTGAVRRWNLRRGTIADLTPSPAPVTAIATGPPAGSGLVLGHADGTLRLWTPDGATRTMPTRHRGAVVSVAAVPGTGGATIVVSIDADGALKARTDDDSALWPRDSPLNDIDGRHGKVRSVAAVTTTRGGVLAVGHEDGTLTFWDPVSGAVALPPTRHTARWSVVPFPMPGGRSLVLAGQQEKLVVLDPVTGESAMTIRSHALSGATSLATTAVPDGVLVAAAADDGSVALRTVGSDGYVNRAGTLVSAANGAALLDVEHKNYTAIGEVGDVLWWAAGLNRFEAGELDAYAGITRPHVLLPDAPEGNS